MPLSLHFKIFSFFDIFLEQYLSGIFGIKMNERGGGRKNTTIKNLIVRSVLFFRLLLYSMAWALLQVLAS